MKSLPLPILLALALAASPARADVRLPALFADHAVLQRDRPLPVWGWAEAGEKVVVTLGKERGEAVTDKDGRWKVVLNAQPVSKNPLELTVEGRNRLVAKDVLLGDVWLCSGQSNMSISLGGFTALEQVKQDIAKAEFPLIRQFGVLEHFADEVQTDVKGEWLVCSPKTSSRFAAVAFYFARRLHAETGIPIGILRSAKGSTRIESWLSAETLLNEKGLEADPRLGPREHGRNRHCQPRWRHPDRRAQQVPAVVRLVPAARGEHPADHAERENQQRLQQERQRHPCG